MEVSDKIILRPRFSHTFSCSPEIILLAFENMGKSQKEFVISRIDDHVFIRLPKSQRNLWSPQLQLEVYKFEDETTLSGLYGPNPTLWTLFMFLHFVIVTLFIGAGIWMYITIQLSTPYVLPLFSMILLFIFWFGLYFVGRWGRNAGKREMLLLQDCMDLVLIKFKK